MSAGCSHSRPVWFPRPGGSRGPYTRLDVLLASSGGCLSCCLHQQSPCNDGAFVCDPFLCFVDLLFGCSSFSFCYLHAHTHKYFISKQEEAVRPSSQAKHPQKAQATKRQRASSRRSPDQCSHWFGYGPQGPALKTHLREVLVTVRRSVLALPTGRQHPLAPENLVVVWPFSGKPTR